MREINPANSQFLKESLQNPSQLAERIWQTIWLASGENPAACLATFVEIFVFKYLSDLGILVRDEAGVGISFDDVIAKDRDKCLVFFFRFAREHIKKLFPPNPEDGTSIINGTVLNPEVEEHNSLFHTILAEFRRFGPLNRIDPEFKSRLYENFLKKSISQKNLGQFFTPRNIVKAMVEMSQMELLPDGARVHDPACGVGGFLLEPMLNKRSRDYGITNAHVACKLRYTGADRDQKTIILGKANMLIHLNELMGLNKVPPKEFSRLFNQTFHSVHTSILGSLAQSETDEYDMILTNPPFVTTGTGKFKGFIKESGVLSSYYVINATGVEGLFVEKIIRSLKPGGKAFVVVPDGILNRSTDKKLRRFIRQQCIVEAVVSLPENAFYTTPKKTYILALTKKTAADAAEQADPVFSYVVTQTGETLDAHRFECPNDLPEMVRLFKYFLADKPAFRSSTLKCKVWPVERFTQDTYWSVDRWWTPDEQVRLGIAEQKSLVTVTEFANRLEQERAQIIAAKERLLALKAQMTRPERMVEIALSNGQFFELFIGVRVKKKAYHGKAKGDIPVYSANVFEPFAWDTTSNIGDFEFDSVLWGIDGDFEFAVKRKGEKYRTTDHCGCARILDPDIDASYLRHCLIAFRAGNALDRQLRASLRNMEKVIIRFPVLVDESGQPESKRAAWRPGPSDPEFIPALDLGMQQQIANFYDTFDAVKAELAARMQKLSELELELLDW